MLRKAPVLRLVKQVLSPARYCFAEIGSNQPEKLSSKLKDEITTDEETPVHLRPYDPKKYEVPSTKLKVDFLRASSSPFPSASMQPAMLCSI